MRILPARPDLVIYVLILEKIEWTLADDRDTADKDSEAPGDTPIQRSPSFSSLIRNPTPPRSPEPGPPETPSEPTDRMIVHPGVWSPNSHLPLGQKFIYKQPRQLTIQVAPGTEQEPMCWVDYGVRSIDFSDKSQVRRLNNWRTRKIREDRKKRKAAK